MEANALNTYCRALVIKLPFMKGKNCWENCRNGKIFNIQLRKWSKLKDILVKGCLSYIALELLGSIQYYSLK